MVQHIHKGLREGTGCQPDPTGSEKLIGNAPTQPRAFLRWGAERTREEGKLELSRGRVTCNMIYASRCHSRVAKNIVLELGHRLDLELFDIGIADLAVRTPFGVRSPDVVVDLANPHRDLSTSAPIFIAEALSPSEALC
jgi:hypothetical protein